MSSEKISSDSSQAESQTESEDRWEWQRRLKANPRTARFYRLGVGIIGLIVVVIGIILLPFPGPGWLVIFVGLGIWASEFDWAQDLLHWVKARVERWWDWLEEKGWWAKALAGLGTAIIVVLIFWALFAISGVPGGSRRPSRTGYPTSLVWISSAVWVLARECVNVSRAPRMYSSVG